MMNSKNNLITEEYSAVAKKVFKVYEGELISAYDFNKKCSFSSYGAFVYYDKNEKKRHLTQPRYYDDLAKIGWYRVTYMNEMPSYDSATEYIEKQYEIVDNFIQVTYVKKTLEV